MNETNDYSKRFFLDFLAARLRASRIEKDAPGQPSQTTSPLAEEDPARMLNQADSRSRETQ
jgi:hypothetical protein